MTTESEYPVMPTIPHNREAEEALVGSAIIAPQEVYLTCSTIVSANDFYIHRHRWVWDAIGRLVSSGRGVDFLTITDELVRMDKLEEVGGPAFLTALVNQVPTTLNAETYAESVRDMAQRRNAINTANNIATDAYDMTKLFDPTQHSLNLVKSTAKTSRRKTGLDVLGDVYDKIYNTVAPIVFGINDIDNRIAGMFTEELTILAGDQGTGKTAVAIHVARKNAERKKRIVFISLEMSAATVWLRMACGDLGVNMNQVRAGKVSSETKADVYKRAQDLAELYDGRITIYESPMSLMDIQAASLTERPDLMIIDHVFLISAPATKNPSEQIQALNASTRFLRMNVAKMPDHRCHVLLLWQLNRGAAKEKRKPTKHDLFMAGTNDPDSIILLHREDMYSDSGVMPGKPVDMTVIIGKARNDFTGEIPTKYDLQHQTIFGIAREDRP